MNLFNKYFKWLPVAAGILWFVARFIAGRITGPEQAAAFGSLSNVLLILIIVFLALFFKYRNFQGERPGFFKDFRDAVRPGLWYVITVMIFMALYYGVLSNEIAVMREAKLQSIAGLIDTDEKLAEVKKNYPLLQDSTREAIENQLKANVSMYISVQSKLLGALLALVLCTVLYAIMAVFFWRSFVKRI